MRSDEEVQHAHDVVVGIILREVPFPEIGMTMRDLNLMAQVLCWVMHHDHNEQFALTLERIADDLRARGFEIVRHDH